MNLGLTSIQLQRLIEALDKDVKSSDDEVLVDYLHLLKQTASLQEKEFIQRSIDLDEIPF